MKPKKDPQAAKAGIVRALGAAQQEMNLTLPGHLLMAFKNETHKEFIDQETGNPFDSFYRWLMAENPPGIGLSGFAHIDGQDIINLLTKCRDRMPASDRGVINGLIEDLQKGYGAKRGVGGRPRKDEKENHMSTHEVNGTPSIRSQTTKASLAARMAESTDPEVRAAYDGYLEGRYASVTAAAIACGIRDDANAPLARLKSNWRKASKADRRAFLKFIEEEAK